MASKQKNKQVETLRDGITGYMVIILAIICFIIMLSVVIGVVRLLVGLGVAANSTIATTNEQTTTAVATAAYRIDTPDLSAPSAHEAIPNAASIHSKEVS